MSPTSYRTAPPRAKINSSRRLTSEISNLRSEISKLVGLGRVELPTSRLSGVRSNQLSYRPPRSFSRAYALNPGNLNLNSKFKIPEATDAFLAQKRATLLFCGPLANGGRAGGPCSFGG